MHSSRLVLGTVQLGMAYGVGNTTGKPSMAESEAIVTEAWKGGVREFDSALTYGDAEKVLGKILVKQGNERKARILSKPSIDAEAEDVEALEKAVLESVHRLGVSSLQSLMWHRESLLDGNLYGFPDCVAHLKSVGLINGFGISVYSPAKAIEALEKPWVDSVQVPGNVLDQRFNKANVFEIAKRLGKIVYVRSVFLQGLLLMECERALQAVPLSEEPLRLFHGLVERFQKSRLEIALGYAKRAWPDAKILFGAERASQVTEIMKAWEGLLTNKEISIIEDMFAEVSERVLNPTLWPNNK